VLKLQRPPILVKDASSTAGHDVVQRFQQQMAQAQHDNRPSLSPIEIRHDVDIGAAQQRGFPPRHRLSCPPPLYVRTFFHRRRQNMRTHIMLCVNLQAAGHIKDIFEWQAVISR
jgi:hypothetical protein